MMHTEAETPGSPLVRFTFLSELLGGDREMLGEVVRIYEESANELIAGIESLLAKGLVPSAKLPAHSLKGASASAGAERMRALAEQLEGALKASDAERARELLGLLRANLASTLSAFSKKFDEIDAST